MNIHWRSSAVTRVCNGMSTSAMAAIPTSLTTDGIEVLNGKRLELLRTPTQVEIDDFGQGGDTDVYAMLTRTLEEQDSLRDGVYPLSAAKWSNR